MNKITRYIAGLFCVPLLLGASECSPTPSSNDKQRDTQERILAEGNALVGLPSIKNFREKKLLKDILELRDQDGLITHTYLYNEMTGKLVFLCDSFGYPIPYATQFTAPESQQKYYIRGTDSQTSSYGSTRLPQADPNGLFSPASAEGTWVMCKNPKGREVRPVYIEPKVITSPFPMTENN